MDKVLTAIRALVTTLVADAASPLYFHATTAKGGIKRVYRGDPAQIPHAEFPCVVVRPVSSSWVKRMTRYDRKEHLVEVIVVMNFNTYKDTDPDDAGVVLAIQTAHDMMESTDTAQKTSAKTIVGVLEANPTLPYSSSGTKYAAVDLVPVSVDYVFNSSRGFPTFEVIALFRVTLQGDRA